MSGQLEKLKSSIKKEYVDKFEYDLMKSSGFIPVDKRQNNFYVIINKRNAQNRDSIVKSIQSVLGEIVPQFIPIEASDFENIFSQLNGINTQTEIQPENSGKQTENEEKSEKQELTAEDMLVGIGWLTQKQLDEAKNISTEKKIPLDGVFIDKEILNPEQVASYLQKKYGYKVISKDDIRVDKSISKMLPDDFTEKKKAVTLSLETGNKLGVAMLNPDDRNTVKEISLSTGRSVFYTKKIRTISKRNRKNYPEH